MFCVFRMCAVCDSKLVAMNWHFDCGFTFPNLTMLRRVNQPCLLLVKQKILCRFYGKNTSHLNMPDFNEKYRQIRGFNKAKHS